MAEPRGLIGELREGVTSGPTTPPPVGDSGSPRCPACGHAQDHAGTCEVCGQRLYGPAVVVASPDVVVGEGIVGFAKKQWRETLHPRDAGGQGGGQFIGKGPLAGVQRSSLATDRVGTPETRKAPPKPKTRGTRAPFRDPPARSRPQAQRSARRGGVKAARGPTSAERPKLSEEQLAKSVGRGRWSAQAATTVEGLKAGTVIDTEQAHRTAGGKGAYTPERTELHARIATLLLQGAQVHTEPEALFMAGGPASGKTSLVKAGHATAPGDAVDVNPDIVKTMLPEYQAMVAAGDTRAAAMAHEESSHVTKLVLNLAVLRRHHIVVDGTGNGNPGSFAKKIKQARNAGMRTRVVYATIPTDEAVSRSVARGAKTGRLVPEGYVRSAHASVSQRYVEDVSALGVAVTIFDTSTRKPTLIAEHDSKGRLTVHRASLFEAFKAKAGGQRAQAQAAQVQTEARSRAGAGRVPTRARVAA